MNVAYLSTRKRETEVIAGMSELLCGTRVARNKGTEGKRETVRPILIKTACKNERLLIQGYSWQLASV